eukprot:gene9787-20353_t
MAKVIISFLAFFLALFYKISLIASDDTTTIHDDEIKLEIHNISLNFPINQDFRICWNNGILICSGEGEFWPSRSYLILEKSLSSKSKKVKDIDSFSPMNIRNNGSEVIVKDKHLQIIFPTEKCNIGLHPFVFGLQSLADSLHNRKMYLEAGTIYNFTLIIQTRENAPEITEDLYCRMFISFGSAYYIQGRWKESLESFTSALSMCSESDMSTMGRTYSNLGASLYKLAQHRDAKTHYERAVLAYNQELLSLSTSEASSHSASSAVLANAAAVGKARSLSSLGTTLRALGCPCAARDKYEEALDLYSSLSSSSSSSSSLDNENDSSSSSHRRSVLRLKSYIATLTGTESESSPVCEDGSNRSSDSCRMSKSQSPSRCKDISPLCRTSFGSPEEIAIEMIVGIVFISIFLLFSVILLASRIYRLINDARKAVARRSRSIFRLFRRRGTPGKNKKKNSLINVNNGEDEDSSSVAASGKNSVEMETEMEGSGGGIGSGMLSCSSDDNDKSDGRHSPSQMSETPSLSVQSKASLIHHITDTTTSPPRSGPRSSPKSSPKSSPVTTKVIDPDVRFASHTAASIACKYSPPTSLMRSPAILSVTELSFNEERFTHQTESFMSSIRAPVVGASERPMRFGLGGLDQISQCSNDEFRPEMSASDLAKAQRGRQRLAAIARKREEEEANRQRQEAEAARLRELKAQKDRIQLRGRLSSVHERENKIRSASAKRGLGHRMEDAAQIALHTRIHAQLSILRSKLALKKQQDRDLDEFEENIRLLIKWKTDDNIAGNRFLEEVKAAMKVIEKRNRISVKADLAMVQAEDAFATMKENSYKTLSEDEKMRCLALIEDAANTIKKRCIISDEADKLVRSLEKRSQSYEAAMKADKVLAMKMKAAADAEENLRKANEQLLLLGPSAMEEIDRATRVATQRLQEKSRSDDLAAQQHEITSQIEKEKSLLEEETRRLAQAERERQEQENLLLQEAKAIAQAKAAEEAKKLEEVRQQEEREMERILREEMEVKAEAEAERARQQEERERERIHREEMEVKAEAEAERARQQEERERAIVLSKQSLGSPLKEKSSLKWNEIRNIVKSPDKSVLTRLAQKDREVVNLVSIPEKDSAAAELEKLRIEQEAETRRLEQERARVAAEEELVRAKQERQRIAEEEEARKREEEKERVREAARQKAKKFEEDRTRAAALKRIDVSDGETGTAGNNGPSTPPSKWGKVRSAVSNSTIIGGTSRQPILKSVSKDIQSQDESDGVDINLDPVLETNSAAAELEKLRIEQEAETRRLEQER